MNSIASIATVATGPSDSRAATMPAAMSIWLSTQPPKMWPLELMSPGLGTTLRIGEPVPVHMMIATILGVGLSILVGTALMGLIFLSSRSGMDDEAGLPGDEDEADR